MKYKGVKIPKSNGRPQLWLRGDQDGGLRIIYPDGTVEQASVYSDWWVIGGYTSQNKAIKAYTIYDYLCRAYENEPNHSSSKVAGRTEFVCYL